MFNHFDILASIYDQVIPQPDYKRLSELLRIPTDGKLLDVGGGTGRVSAQLHALVHSLIIVDSSRKMLARAKSKNDLWPVLSRGERLPFPDQCFERILVVDSLHHFSNQDFAISELIRVLKSGGRLVIEEPDIRRWVVSVIALVEKLTFMHSHFLSATEIQQMVADNGLAASIHSEGGFQVWIVVEK